MSAVDFNSLPPGYEVKASVSRVEHPSDRRIRLFKDVTFHLTALIVVGLIVYICYITLISAAASAEEKKWAMSVLSAAAGGIIGYLVRK